ncbi:MAG: endonuclease/exonuclease/phosphatase family protein [Planctomycetaceae bacterium]|nr:endonuclease/exonuclease/phosphatase family protein [Planctomycetaceae bacterium]
MDSTSSNAGSSADPSSNASRLSWRRVFRLSVILMAAPTLIGWLARRHWIFDLATHFVVQSAVLMAVFLAISLVLRDWRMALLAAVVLVINAARIVPLYLPADEPSSTGQRIRLLSANVHTGNRNAAPFLELVQREDPDIILVMEVDARWIRELSLLRDRYPHFHEHGRPDNFGIALYSKIPLDGLDEIEVADSEVPTLLARLKLDGRSMTLIGTHPLPPISRDYTGLRNRQLAALGELAAREATHGPVVLAGDLNTTSWSPIFADLLKASGLRDSRLGRGLQASWPTTSPLILIPIDHVLISPDLAIHDRRLGDPIGSDHWPVVVDFSVN